jgi:hypothetical protein
VASLESLGPVDQRVSISFNPLSPRQSSFPANWAGPIHGEAGRGHCGEKSMAPVVPGSLQWFLNQMGSYYPILQMEKLRHGEVTRFAQALTDIWLALHPSFQPLVMLLPHPRWAVQNPLDPLPLPACSWSGDFWKSLFAHRSRKHFAHSERPSQGPGPANF